MFRGWSRRQFLATSSAAVLAPSCLSAAATGAPTRPQEVPDGDMEKIAAAMPAAQAKPARPRKALNFYRTEGFVHRSIGWGNACLKMLGETTGAFTCAASDDMAMFDPGALDEFDVVIFNNSTRLGFENPIHRRTLMDFMDKGKGIAGIHAATDNFYTWPEAAEMMGGLFNGHPWGAGGTWAMQVEGPGHPVNRGFDGQGFWLKDEIYNLKAPYSRERLRILVGLDMTKQANQKNGREDKDQAISWVRSFGRGRVFYCSMGHNELVYWQKPVVTHYLDGIQFAIGDLKADATPSADLKNRPEVAPAPERKS